MFRKLASTLILAALAPLPSFVLADDGMHGSVTVGGAFVGTTTETYKFGEYSGITGDTFYQIIDADLNYDSGPYYFDIRASRLGVENRRAYIETGRYGGYRLFLEYAETPKLISNSSKTVFDGTGTSRLTLPSGFTTGSQTTNFTNLGSYRHDVNLELLRKSGKVGLSDTFGSADVAVSFEREHKDGIKYIGGTLGTSGGNTRSVGLAEPVEYFSDTVRFTAAHTGDAAQVQFDYYLSVFDNNNESLVWDNPFTVTNYPTVARTSLPPDSIHHRVSLSGGVDLPMYSRLSAIFEYGIMEQDEDLLPYSNNTASTVTVPVPRQSAEARIETTHLGLNLSSRPVTGLALKAGYRFYQADNKLPRTLFRYVKNDMGQAQEALTSASALYTLPYAYAQNQFKLDASYYLFSGTTLRAGLAHELIDRDYREVQTTKENTYKAGVNSTFIPHTSVGFDYLKAKREGGDEYDEAKIYEFYHTQDYIDTVYAPIRFDNHPLARKFDIADRERDRYNANFTVFPTDTATLSAYFSYNSDEYDESVFGLQSARTRSITLDGSIAPVGFATVYAFYTKEEMKSEQASRSYSGGTTAGSNKDIQSVDSTRDWTAVHDDDVDTFGLGTKLSFLEDRATVNVDYAFSQSTSAIRFTAGSGISTALIPKDLPDLKTRLHTLNVTGKYKLNRQLSLGAGYKFEDYKSDDWAYDNFAPASSTIPNVLTLVGPVADYEAHTGMVFLTYSL